jgi:DNA-binding IscR family transcriptional regulator
MKKSKPTSNFLPVPHELIEKHLQKLGNAAFVVFLILYQLAHRYGDQFYHSDQLITDKYGISLAMLRRSRKKLKELGFIKYSSGSNIYQRATIYILLPDKKLYAQFRMSNVSKTDRGGDQDD